MTTSTPSVSFFSKDDTTCPVCKFVFNREIMRTGGGRLISLHIRDDLRRVYKESKKYGKIYPLIYNVVVCPSCWFASLPDDFLAGKEFNLKLLKEHTGKRKELSKIIFENTVFNFSNKRNLETGLLSFFLAINCYNYYNNDSYSKVKKALCAMRASWCCFDLMEKGESDFEAISQYFRLLAFNCYEKYMESSYQSKDKFLELENYGPDLDNNYGYVGFLYLLTYLGCQFIDLLNNQELQYKKLNEYRISLSKVFGFGKPSKKTPSALIGKAKELYENIKIYIEKIEENPNFTISKN